MMNERLQILYMCARIVRLASERWGRSISEVNRLFCENGVYRYIHDYWGIFHVEGDEAVLDDIAEHLRQKGVVL